MQRAFLWALVIFPIGVIGFCCNSEYKFEPCQVGGRDVASDNWAVITFEDVPIDTPLVVLNCSLKHRPGYNYRVYATFASNHSEQYARNVYIYDDTGATLTVAGLSQQSAGNSREVFAADYRLLQSPITIRDTNTAATERVPFTIYFVKEIVDPLPVMNARLAQGRIHFGWTIAKGMTIISAEQKFSLSNFSLPDHYNQLHFEPSGYNRHIMHHINGIMTIGPNVRKQCIIDNEYGEKNCLRKVFWKYVEPESVYITVYGPLATLHNGLNNTNMGFRFDFVRNKQFDGLMPDRTSYFLFSPEYRNFGRIYSQQLAARTPLYNSPHAYKRTLFFENDTDILIRSHDSTFSDEQVHTINLTVTDSAGVSTNASILMRYDLNNTVRGKSIEFSAPEGEEFALSFDTYPVKLIPPTLSPPSVTSTVSALSLTTLLLAPILILLD